MALKKLLSKRRKNCLLTGNIKQTLFNKAGEKPEKHFHDVRFTLLKTLSSYEDPT